MGCCGRVDKPQSTVNTEQLVSKWSTVIHQSDHIFTWTETEALAYLAELASTASLVVESGCYLGRSAKVMLDANPKLHMWTVDKFMVAGTEHTTRFFLAEEIKQGRCEIIVGDSQRALEMLQHVAGKIDLAWVDDGHAEEDLLRDIRCLSPLMRPGGIMVGHDFEVPHNDVARGVIQSGVPYTNPLPRVWQYIR